MANRPIHRGRLQVYRDKLVKFVVVVPDSADNRRWLQSFKARWKTRLEQLELWVVSYPIDDLETSIVSHATARPSPDPTTAVLQDQAKRWMDEQRPG